MPSGIILEPEEYQKLVTLRNEFELWNMFMDTLDVDPALYAAELERQDGKPGNALYVLFERYRKAHVS